MRISKWLENNTERLDGKKVAVTGSTGGLGKELCRHLAALGASLILVDRNIEKSRAFADELRAAFPEVSITHITANMEDMTSVKAAAEALLQINVDFLILNAGAYAIPRKKCGTGFDNVFQINFLSPYYLSRRLFPSVSERGGRIVTVSSIAHNYSETDFDDIDFSTKKKASLVYGNAKRFLTYSLSELYGDTGSLGITHPGITFTNITAHYPKLIFAIIKYPMKVIFMSPRRASLSILYGIFTPTGKREWIGPRLFNVWGLPKRKRLNTAGDDEIRRIADKAEELYKSL